MLNTIVETATSICRAQLADIAIVEGENIHIRASFGELGRPAGQVVSLDRSTAMGRAVLDKEPVHIADLQSAGDDFRKDRELAWKYGHRTIVGVPLMRQNRAIGALLLRRSEVELFSEKQIALLQNFADQAVIAIENTRLFEAEQASKRELTEFARISDSNWRGSGRHQPLAQPATTGAGHSGGDRSAVVPIGPRPVLQVGGRQIPALCLQRHDQ